MNLLPRYLFDQLCVLSLGHLLHDETAAVVLEFSPNKWKQDGSGFFRL